MICIPLYILTAFLTVRNSSSVGILRIFSRRGYVDKVGRGGADQEGAEILTATGSLLFSGGGVQLVVTSDVGLFT